MYKIYEKVEFEFDRMYIFIHTYDRHMTYLYMVYLFINIFFYVVLIKLHSICT